MLEIKRPFKILQDIERDRQQPRNDKADRGYRAKLHSSGSL